MSKRVKAIGMGFKGGRRIREGTIFYVEDHEKSKWFIDYPEKFDGPKAEPEDKKDVADLMM